MEYKPQENIRFDLIGIKTEQFAVFEENYDHNCSKTDIHVSFRIKINQSKRQIAVWMEFGFFHFEKLIMKLVVSCHFAINPGDWSAIRHEDKLVFHSEFITHLSDLTLGTARGILHGKTEGTVFSKVILPLFDLSDRFHEHLVFNIDAEQ